MGRPGRPGRQRILRAPGSQELNWSLAKLARLPIGQIWSGAMMLDHLGQPEAGAAVVDAIAKVLAGTGVRTPDLGGTATTTQVTQAVLDALG